jgi:hypothetical protein
VVYGATDPSWNEIDIGMSACPGSAVAGLPPAPGCLRHPHIKHLRAHNDLLTRLMTRPRYAVNNVLGELEFHATVFTADKDLPTATMMDALNFAAAPIGTSASVTAPVTTINSVKVPKVFYNSSFASQFHTYKVVWEKAAVTWMVDTVVYRNITYSPWRPMSIRQILRTNKGINAVGPQFGDSNVYLRRIRYTPLSDKAVADAFRCTSSFACNGPMPKPQTAIATTYVSMATKASAATGRRLLDDVSDSQRLLEAAVAEIVPGIPSQDVDAAPSTFGISFRLTIDRLNPQGLASPTDALTVYATDALQPSLISGLAGDIIPSPDNIVIQSVTQDATTTKVRTRDGYRGTRALANRAIHSAAVRHGSRDRL